MTEQQREALLADFLALEAELREELRRPRPQPLSFRRAWRWLTTRLFAATKE